MEFKSIVEELLPIRLRSQVVKCQNALRFYIRLHQTNVEKLEWAENAEAKRNIIVAEEKMLEINLQQKKVLRKIDMILENYCKSLVDRGAAFDRDIIYGTANRLISKQLEKTVQKERPPQDALMRAAMVKKLQATPYQVSLLKHQQHQRKDSTAKGSKAILRTPPRGIRAPTKIISPQINNSRMNLLQALKKAKDEVKEDLGGDDDDDEEKEEKESTDSESFVVPAKRGRPARPKPANGNDGKTNKVEKITAAEPIVETRRRRKTILQPMLVDNDAQPLETSSSSSEKSSRRNSIEEGPRQPTTMEELGQSRFLRIFDLLTHEELKEYQSRRVSRRRRNCTSTNRKDFHYGNYEPEPIRLNSTRPVLYSPPLASKPKEIKKRFLQPVASTVISKRPKLLPAKFQVNTINTKQENAPKIVNKKLEPARDLKPCISCSRLEDTEKMNACLICYNFYHLSCHVLQRESQERENMCPLCIKRMIHRRKRQLELKKELKYQVLHANHKASVMQAKQKLVMEAAASATAASTATTAS